MGNQQVNVALNFTANTQQAKTAMSQLQQSLTSIAAGVNLNVNSAQVQSASAAAKELAYHLNAAYNVNTGKLDLSKLNMSLKGAQSSIEGLSSKILSIGPQGQQAFVQLAQSISMAQAPVFQLNAVMTKLWATMKNVVVYQGLSMAFQGVVSSISEAYNFAKDLNKSLTDIRIVTEYSADEMDRFAKRANEAAKALSTTTTELTKASLIYFQQGLDMDEAQKRAEITVKMANVTGESVEQVSDQLTAVWNNFAKGGENLEYYADVMTALGAATASSTDEIAQGLEKFAAIGETVGLTYEYATTALATVTATTRQSADVVGTAFKTLFARIQDLELGNTLDDGTTLGQYSEALAKVGISIKDSNGQLKDMNTILDNMGAVWKDLTRDQQTALAQNVAGIRQYTQLMALMENWDYFNENLEVAQNSAGTLQSQQIKYAQSWEAASNRLTASLEDLYTKMIDDDFFIGLVDGLAEVTDGVDNVIEKMGGIGPIITGIVGLLMSSLSHKIQPAIQSVMSSLLTLTPQGAAKQAAKITKPTAEKINSELQTGNYGISDTTSLKNSQSLMEAKNKLWAVQNKMTAAEKQQYETELNIIQLQQQRVQQSADELQSLQEQLKTKKAIADTVESDLAVASARSKGPRGEQAIIQNISKKTAEANALGALMDSGVATDDEAIRYSLLREEIQKLNAEWQQYNKNTEEIKAATNAFVNDGVAEYERLAQAAAEAGEAGINAFRNGEAKVNVGNLTKTFFDNNADTFQSLNASADMSSAKGALIGLKDTLGPDVLNQSALQKNGKNLFDLADNAADGDQLKSVIEQIKKALADCNIEADKLGKSLSSKGQGKTINDINKNLDAQADKYRDVAAGQERVNRSVKNFNPKHVVGFTERLSSLAGAAMTASMALSAMSSVIRTFKDGFDITSIEDWTSVLMGLGMMIPAITSGIKLFGQSLNVQVIGSMLTATAATKMYNAAIEDENIKTLALTAAKRLEHATDKQGTLTSLANLAVKKGLTTEEEKEAFILGIVNATKEKSIGLARTQAFFEAMQTAATNGNVIAKWALNAAEKAGVITKTAETGAVIANTAAWYANPIMWIAVIIIAVIAAIVALTMAFMAQNKAIDENNKQLVENSKKNLELIDSNQELADSIDTLVEKYQDLEATGKSTYDTMEELKEQLPELIKSYEDLETALGVDLGLAGLRALNEGVQDGYVDVARLQEELNRINGEVAKQELKQAQQGAAAARDRMITAARAGDGKLNSDGQYEVTIGGTSTQTIEWKKDDGSTEQIGEEEAAKRVLKSKMGEMWDGSKIKFDANDTTSVIEGYQKMAEARAEMERKFTSEQLAHMDTYRELKRELGEMEESYADLLEFSNEIGKSAKEDFAAGGDKKLANEFNINNLQDYENQRKAMIARLKEKYDGLTDSQAEALLASSELFSHYETSMDLFEDQGRIAADLEKRGTLTLDAVRQWYETLPEQDKKLFLNIDFTEVGSLEEAKAQLEEIREKSQEALIKAEVQSLEVDINTFETYTDILVDNNEALAENNALSKQIALNNLRVNKGLGELADAWEDIEDILKSGNRNSLEYAEALGTIKNALETAFEYAPSTDFIESHLTDIQKLAEGDVKALQDLQDELAQDYVANLEYKTAIIGDTLSLGEVQERLNSFLDQLDTSLEIGEDVEINQKYYDSLQEMLDSGQLAAEDLQKMMRMKGFEMEITGWKSVKGPTTISYQNIYEKDESDNWVKTGEKKFEASEDIQVPIINGDASNISSGSVSGAAKVKRSNTSASIDTSVLNKNKSSKDKKKVSDEIERYHEVDKTLESLKRRYDEINKAKDRAFGKTHLAYIEQELELNEKMIEATQEKLDLAKQYLEQDRKVMTDKWGASIDEYGNISNYDELMAAQVAAYNKDPEGYEEKYQQFIKDMENYESSISTLEELQLDLIDKQNEQRDKQLEAINYEAEITATLSENSIKHIEFQLSQLEDKPLEIAAKLKLIGASTDQTMANMDSAETAIAKILGVSTEDLQSMSQDNINALVNSRDFTQDELDSLQTHLDTLQSGAEDLRAARDQISETLIEGFEAMNEDFDDQQEAMAHSKSIISDYKNLIDLAGGKDVLGLSGKVLEDMAASQAKIAKSNIQVAKAQYEQNKASLDSLQKQIDEAKARGDEASVEELEEAYDQVLETVRENESDMLAATATALEDMTALFEQQMDNIIGDFEDSMAGAYGTFAALQEAFDQRMEIKDRYLDDYQKIYELSKLNRDIVNSIDETDSIRAKERLRDLQEEITELQESGAEMTKYEVDELRARYDLRLAEIALEDAQNAKSQVRMRRGADGNWGYVYTADEEAVGKAEQNYEDKLYAYQQLVQNYTDEMQSKLISIPQQYAEAVKAIYQDQTLNDQERQLKIAETQQYYEEMYDYVAAELGKSTEDAKKLYTEDWSAYSQMTGYKISTNEQWVDDFDETVIAQVTGFNTLNEATNTFKSNSETMLNTVAGKYEEYRQEVKATLELAVGDIQSFYGDENSGLHKYMLDAQKDAQKWSDEAKEAAKENAAAFKDAVTAASTWLSTYSAKIDDWNKKTSSIGDAVNGVTAEYAKLTKEIEKAIGAQEEYNNTPKTGSNNGDKGNAGSDIFSKANVYQYGRSDKAMMGTGGESKSISKSDVKNVQDLGSGVYKVTLNSGSSFYTDYTGALEMDQKWSTKYSGSKNRFLSSVKNETVKSAGNGKYYFTSLGMEYLFTQEDLERFFNKTYSYAGYPVYTSKFDTGGYTGEWDSSGRLAMLHQKELVLNADDTKNFLAAVDILRGITQSIDLQAASQSNVLGAITAASVTPNEQKLEQEVTIHAEFPNATQRTEIEAAFDSLLNRASQFANRKN